MDIPKHLPNRKHASLRTDVAQISTVEAFAQFHNRLVINLARLADRLSVNPENLHSSCLIRQWNLNFAIDTAWTQQGWIKRVGLSEDRAKISVLVRSVDRGTMHSLDLLRK